MTKGFATIHDEHTDRQLYGPTLCHLDERGDRPSAVLLHPDRDLLGLAQALVDPNDCPVLRLKDGRRWRFIFQAIVTLPDKRQYIELTDRGGFVG